jgi:7-cyano-7-deazaguanine synthase
MEHTTENPKKSIVLIFSGGMDSTAALYLLLAHGHTVRCLSVDYGQRHAKELEYAKAICDKLDIDHKVADLSAIKHLLAGSSQTSDEIDVPEGHYAAENMKLTVVPNRNMIMLSVAIGWAISTKSDAVCFGAHDGDHAIYPDCRAEFAEVMNKAAGLCDWHHVELWRPFIQMSKADIAKLGFELGVPFQETWSCYKGGPLHCGKCGTCVERREAFELAGIQDPTLYDTDLPPVAAGAVSEATQPGLVETRMNAPSP